MAKQINPERISGHNLVNYLLANPEARGNFKWHTLRSCMWRNLLVKCPQFAEFGTSADFQKITHSDALKIIDSHWELTEKFPQNKFSDYDWLWIVRNRMELFKIAPLEKFNGYMWSMLLQKHPALENLCPWEKLSGGDWCLLLLKQKQFAERCPWEKMDGGNWSFLLRSASNFADKCNWQRLKDYDWLCLLRKKKTFLAQYKLQYIKSAYYLNSILEACYFGDTAPEKGLFTKNDIDVPSYQIYKSMDKENAKKFLKNKYERGDWQFIRKLCNVSLEEAIEVDGKKYMPFYLALTAPDEIFYKFFQNANTTIRDTAGNSLLFPALIRDIDKSKWNHYNYLLERGFNPDEKNLAGFSCSDLLKHFKIRYAR